MISQGLLQRCRNIVLLFGSMLTVMGGMAVAPGAARMAEHFADAPNADLLVRLVVTIPLLAVAISSSFMGGLVDRYGRRSMLLVCSLAGGLIGVSGYFLDSLFWILVSRFFLGVVNAGLMAALTTVIGDLFFANERQRFLGLQSMAMSMGALVSVGLGGLLADISWRMPFLIYGLSFVLFIGIGIFIEETGGSKHQDAESKGNPSEGLDEVSKFSVVFSLAPVYLMGMLLGALFYTAPVQLPFLFQELGLSATKAGLALVCMNVTAALFGYSFHTMAAKFGNWVLLVISVLSMAFGFIIVGHGSVFSTVALGLVCVGIGVGLFVPLGNSLCMAAVNKTHMGFAVGTFASFLFLGQFLSPIVVAPVLYFFPLSDALALLGELALLAGVGLIAYKAFKAFVKAN